MNPIAVLQLLVLLAVANGAPVLAKKVLGGALAQPLDGGLCFFDRRPLLGPSKTMRGIAVSVILTAAAAPFLGLELSVGAVAGAAAMAGDLFSSFVKRRLALPQSSRALGLDQVPESLFPLLACAGLVELRAADVVVGVAAFFAGAVVLSRLCYRLGLRDQPF